MKVTAQEEYGLRCLVQVARGHAQGRSLSITEIAQGEGLSTPYVGKILAVLRKGGLVTAARGRSGGYTLTRNPRAITLDVRPHRRLQHPFGVGIHRTGAGVRVQAHDAGRPDGIRAAAPRQPDRGITRFDCGPTHPGGRDELKETR
jgi:DNA-binding transcriptional ArsR family regulator